jgi:hypothetical protein
MAFFDLVKSSNQWNSGECNNAASQETSNKQDAQHHPTPDLEVRCWVLGGAKKLQYTCYCSAQQGGQKMPFLHYAKKAGRCYIS